MRNCEFEIFNPGLDKLKHKSSSAKNDENNQQSSFLLGFPKIWFPLLKLRISLNEPTRISFSWRQKKSSNCKVEVIKFALTPWIPWKYWNLIQGKWAKLQGEEPIDDHFLLVGYFTWHRAVRILCRGHECLPLWWEPSVRLSGHLGMLPPVLFVIYSWGHRKEWPGPSGLRRPTHRPTWSAPDWWLSDPESVSLWTIRTS